MTVNLKGRYNTGIGNCQNYEINKLLSKQLTWYKINFLWSDYIFRENRNYD